MAAFDRPSAIKHLTLISDSAESPCPQLVAITPVAELLYKSWMGRRPIELGSSLGRDGALIDQEDLGEIVA